MATIKGKTKQGYVISIQKLGLNTSRQTYTDKKRKADDICSEITARETEVKKDLNHPFHHKWDKKERSNYILYGLEPKAEEKPSLTVEDACRRYIDNSINLGKAFNTVQSYEHHLFRVINYFGTQKVEDLTPGKIQDFVFWLNQQEIKTGRNRGSKLGIETQKKIVAAFRRVVKWNVSQGELDFPLQYFDCVGYAKRKQATLDKLEKWCYFGSRVRELQEREIPLDTEGAFREVVYSKDELMEHLEYLKRKLWFDGTPRERKLFVAVYFCIVTGCRRSELLRVRRSDLRLDDLQVVIWRRKGRGDLDLIGHRVVITSELVPYLQGLLHQLPEGQQCIFATNDAHVLPEGFDEAMEANRANDLHQRLAEALEGSKYSNAVGFHVYRHTLASLLMLAGHSQAVVMETVGWCSPEMAKRYSHLAQERKQTVIADVLAN